MFRRFLRRRAVQSVRRFTRPLSFERLEERCLLTTFTVDTKNDSGNGSLRQAMLDANENEGADRILFDAGLAGKTIQIDSSLPPITESLKILNNNGTSVTVDGQDKAGVRPFNVQRGTVTLKQLTITGGNVDGEVDGSDNGGGIVNQGGILTLNSCIVTRNQASEDDENDGGGIANEAGGVLSIKNSTISNNRAEEDGGGISNGDGELHLLGTKIKSNFAGRFGGGIFASDSAIVTITDSTIAANVADDAGGIFSTSTMTVERTTISANREGGVAIAAGTASFFNSTIAHNITATDDGAGFAQNGGTLSIVNCTIVGNADTGNNAVGAGGIAKTGGTLDLRNTIVAGNFAGPDSVAENVELADLNVNINNFIGDDARLGPLDAHGGPTQTMPPLKDSPVINTGDNDAANQFGLTSDQRGLTRIVGGTVDIGAVETQAGEPLPLKSLRDGRGSSNRNEDHRQPRAVVAALTTFTVTNKNDAGAGSLRDAIEDANDNAGEDKILFAANVAGKSIKLNSSLPQITESLKVLNNNAQNVTVDGLDNEGVRPFNIAAAATVTLKKLTITGGNVDATIDGSQSGAGIVNQGGVLTLNDCIVTGNQASAAGGDGGGIANLDGGLLTIKGGTISNNSAGGSGGGIFNVDAELRLTGAKVNSNTAGLGGGVANLLAIASIKDCTIAGNVSEFDGGGIDNGNAATLTVERCTISGNRADRFGGGVSTLNATTDIVNSTIAYNLADAEGGGLDQTQGTLRLVNCTIVGNADTGNFSQGAGGISEASGSLTGRNSIIAGNFAGPDSASDNVELSDLDEDTANFIAGDPRLGPLDSNGGATQTMAPLDGSPVIDAGDNTSANDAGLTDQRGLTRIVNGTVDIGAVETQAGEPLPLLAPREQRSRDRERAALTTGAFDVDLAFAAAVMNHNQPSKRDAAARFAAFAQLAATEY